MARTGRDPTDPTGMLLVPLLGILEGIGGAVETENALVQRLLGGLSALGVAPTLSGLLLAFLGLVLARQRRHALALGRTLGAANRNLHGTVQESLAGIKLTKILGQEGRHLEQFRQTLAQLRAQQIGFAASTSLSRAFVQVASAVLLAAYLYLGPAVWDTPVPELLTLVLISSRVIPLLMSAQQHMHHWLHALPALEETERLLADCHAAAEPAAESMAPSLPMRKAIELAWIDGDQERIRDMASSLCDAVVESAMTNAGCEENTSQHLMLTAHRQWLTTQRVLPILAGILQTDAARRRRGSRYSGEARKTTGGAEGLGLDWGGLSAADAPGA